MTKRILAASLSACFAVAIASESSHEEAKWWVGKGERNGHALIVRALGEVPDATVRANYHWLGTISWSYAQQSDGMPDRDDAEKAFDFENLLEARIEHTGLAMQAISITGNGKHDWSYHASDRSKFFAAFEAVKNELPNSPVSMEIHADDTWQALQDVLRAARK